MYKENDIIKCIANKSDCKSGDILVGHSFIVSMVFVDSIEGELIAGTYWGQDKSIEWGDYVFRPDEIELASKG